MRALVLPCVMATAVVAGCTSGLDFTEFDVPVTIVPPTGDVYDFR